MQISEIQIECFGVWHDLRLPLNPAGVSVVYGPNEAGKTTLMRFIRSVLFGFRAAGENGGDYREPLAGSLCFEHEGRTCRLHRVSGKSPRGDLVLSGGEVSTLAQDIPDRVLRGVSESLFDNVFAVGLRQLQELGTLTDGEAAERIYGLTLGLSGRRILQTYDRLRSESGTLLSADRQTGELTQLFKHHELLTTRRQQAARQIQKYAELGELREQLEEQIAELKTRETGIQSQLRGHLFLDRAIGPWSKIRELEAELAGIPVVSGFPDRGVTRLNELENDLARATEARDNLYAQVKKRKLEKKSLEGLSHLSRHAPAMQGLIDQRGLIENLHRQYKAARCRADEAALDVEAELERLGPGWTMAHLAEIDVSSGTHQRLAGMARSLRLAATRRRTLQKKIERRKAAFTKERDRLTSELIQLNAPTVAQAIQLERKRLQELKNLGQLRLIEAELLERQESIEEHAARVAPRTLLPSWVYVVLSVFCMAGVVLGISGLWTGIAHSGIAGLIYALLGLTAGGLAWGLKVQFEGDAIQHLAEVKADANQNRAELREIQDEIQRLTGETKPSVTNPADSKSVATKNETPIAAQALGSASSARQMERAKGGLVPKSATRHAVPADLDDNEFEDGFEGEGDEESEYDESDYTDEELAQLERERAFRWSAEHHTPLSRGLARLRHKVKQTASGLGTRVKRWHALRRERMAEFERLHRARVARQQQANISAAQDEVDEALERPALAELQLISQCTHKIATLEELGRQQQRLKAAAKRRPIDRERLETARKNCDTLHKNWNELVAEVGLPANDDVEAIFRCWGLVIEIREKHRDAEQAAAQAEQCLGLWNTFQQRIEELGHRMQVWDVKYDDPMAVLSTWEQQLAELARHRERRRTLVHEARVKQREARQFDLKIDEIRLQCHALLTQGGASDPEEFRQRADWAARRRELGDELAEVREELDHVCHDHRDLALVEEDMLVFQPDQNRECIRVLKDEMEDLDRDQQSAFERLGSVKRDLEHLEAEDKTPRLALEVAHLEDRLTDATTRWFGLQAASRALDRVRQEFERRCQPATLASASQFLTDLTCGRYRNVWTPLGERSLLVDDEHGESLPVEKLSCGTREQLFLAVRLALMKDLAAQGIQLPIVLDDIFVNFDHQRAAAAAQVLMQFAAGNRQILFFTCHQHLARLFADLGAPTLELPAHVDHPAEQRRRLAG